MLLRGPPGSGKTPVAKSVALSLDREKRLAASFFFEKKAASLEFFVSTLATQIAERHPWYGSAVEQIIFDTPSILRQPPTVQLHRLIIDPLRAVYASTPELIQDCFIVADGLEQCRAPEDLDELNTLVAGLEGLPIPFRFFLSYRSDFPDEHGLDLSIPLPTHEDILAAISTPSEDKHTDTISPVHPNTRSQGHLKISQLWDLSPGKVIGAVLTGHTDNVCSVSFSPDGSRIASGSWDHIVRIWDAGSGETIGQPLRGHTKEVNAVSFSPNGKWVVSGSHDRTVRIWDAESGTAIGEPLRGGPLQLRLEP